MKNITKLVIELVPQTAWHASLFNLFKDNNQSAIWNDIKNRTFETEGKKCWICGATGIRFEAHEFWEYDDKKHIQKLVAIHHLCGLCHKVKHIGLWLHTTDGERMLEQQHMDKQDVIDHFCKVNNCSETDFEKHEEEAFKVFAERSSHEWKQDFGLYTGIIEPLIKMQKTGVKK